MKTNRGYTIVELLQLICFLAFIGVGLWVIYHFISKYW